MTKKIRKPNILDKVILDTLINGTYYNEELKLGLTKEAFNEAFRKLQDKSTNALKSYQDIYFYSEEAFYEEGESYIALWFEGTKDDKRKYYQLRTIEFVYPHIKQFTEKFMRDMLGQPDLEYLSGYQMHYCYGNVIFMFTQIKNKWQLTNIRYQDDAYKAEHRLLFDK